MRLFCLHVCLYTMCVLGASKGSEEGIGSSRIGVRDSCEPAIWVLGMDPRSSARALSALNWLPLQHLHFLKVE